MLFCRSRALGWMGVLGFSREVERIKGFTLTNGYELLFMIHKDSPFNKAQSPQSKCEKFNLEEKPTDQLEQPVFVLESVLISSWRSGCAMLEALTRENRTN